jgi:hypothetical protein
VRVLTRTFPPIILWTKSQPLGFLIFFPVMIVLIILTLSISLFTTPNNQQPCCDFWNILLQKTLGLTRSKGLFDCLCTLHSYLRTFFLEKSKTFDLWFLLLQPTIFSCWWFVHCNFILLINLYCSNVFVCAIIFSCQQYRWFFIISYCHTTD